MNKKHQKIINDAKIKIWVKSPSEIQDLIILTLAKKFEYRNRKFHYEIQGYKDLTTIPVENRDSYEFILGINKTWNKIGGGFDVNSIPNNNDRHLEYLKYLKFQNIIDLQTYRRIKTKLIEYKTQGVSIKSAINKTDFFSISSIPQTILGFSSLEDADKSFYKKLKVVSWWIDANIKDNISSEISRDKLSVPVLEYLNNNLEINIPDIDFLSELSYEDINNNNNITFNRSEFDLFKKDIIDFFSQDNSLDNKYLGIISLVDKNNYLEIMNLWIESLELRYRELSKSEDLWDLCGFNTEKSVVINISGKPIKNWKKLLRVENRNFFVTPDLSNSSWIIISINNKKFPILNDSGLLYWVHESKYMGKAKNYDDIISYVHYISNVYFRSNDDIKEDNYNDEQSLGDINEINISKLN